MKHASSSIIRQLQIVFSVSVILLIISLIASFYSTRKLIDNSRLVNHTNEVLIEAEKIMSRMKDAETGQRGYLVTKQTEFLEPYNGAYAKTMDSYSNLVLLTSDNPIQQKNLEEIKVLFTDKFRQMQKVIDLTQDNNFLNDTTTRLEEMRKGKILMDDLRLAINRIKTAETKLLDERIGQQQTYITYTPILLLIAALISILITAFAYVKIKRDLDERIRNQKLAEKKYAETSERIAQMEGITREISDGDYSVRSTDEQDDELGRISKALNIMTGSLQTTFTDLENKTWLQSGVVAVSDAMRDEKDITKLAQKLINTLTEYLQTPLGTLYILDRSFEFSLSGSYAALNAPRAIKAGEGLAGQALETKRTIVITELPEDYLRVESSLGNTLPSAVVIVPLIYGGEAIGVIELGFLSAPTELEIEFLEKNAEPIAIGINSALDFIKLQNFLEETQAQSEELQAQHNELENLNTELEAQSQKLQASEEELRVQQEELQQTNEELEERSGLLEEKNIEIVKKARELEISTRYKSEFLANMSHELRTPLNSILLLSRLLSENNDENLTDDQVEYARVIQSSGNGLLGLIDEILDLSKIEAGKMSLDFEKINPETVASELHSLFNPLAKEKGVEFIVDTEAGLPAVETDKMRLEQILKNLLSNALKFTSKGSVSLRIGKNKTKENSIFFAVKDTGIGIPKDKQQLIFEAFQQADGSTKRKYGGTGLGLSISRELVKLLGGEISLSSTEKEGSEFILYLPLTPGKQQSSVFEDEIVIPEAEEKEILPEPKKYLSTVIPENVPDDRNDISEQDKTILIVEDDTNFAKSLLDYTRKKGFKGIVAVRGDEGIKLAGTFKPMGILLDIELPVKNGWEVMEELKSDPKTRHIPVHIMSSHYLKTESMMKGAIDFINKPMAFEQMQGIFEKIEYVVNKESKKVLILEDNPKHAKALAYYLETFNINSELKSDLTEGIESLKSKTVDCVILDMGIPDAKAYEVLEEAKKNPGLENLPIIIFTGKSLSLAEELRIKQYADSIIVKTAHSYQRMLDEVSLFLHIVEENKKTGQKSSFKNLGGLTEVLHNKTVLIADDDVRNIFSLSKALENFKMNIVTALDGKEALEKLHENPSIDVVLLDMMMPKMDGYETAARIRENPLFKDLPVIAVTAKAMTGDREKCINAGASDYITKPVDIDQLVSLLRVWLYER